MRFARGLLIFSYGLFSIAAQTLLFREFITTFEGNDISVGIFFGSWFLWVGLGALFVYKTKIYSRILLKNIEFLFLAYVPAFILQAILIIQAREIAGIESYELWSIWAMLLSSIVVNAPVSLITGMLFPTACRWIASNDNHQSGSFAVSHVYILEAIGSFIGGLGVTVLLGLGASMVEVFFILVFILSLSVFAVEFATIRTLQISRNKNALSLRIKCALSFLVPVAICLCFLLRVDGLLSNYVRAIKWTKLLPENALVGSFQTAQAEYIYGIYQGQWIAIREGSVVEALPDESSAGRIAAISLSQKPNTKKALVIGSGLGLCKKLLELPRIEGVTWTHCDNEYVSKINGFIPADLKVTDPRLDFLTSDVRDFLAGEQQAFDIVILNLPDATNSVLNRYYTLEFYQLVKKALRPDGVLAVRVAGGENIMGTELINLGASTKRTLEQVYSQLVLVPGDDTWFIASDSDELTGNPAVLRDRFATIEGANKILSPQALLSIYLPDRADSALKSYSLADLPDSLLINRDARPLTNLYSLLLTAKQSGAPIARFIKLLALAGPLVFLVPILIFIVLRVVYILPLTRQGQKNEYRETSFDSSFLVFSAGWLGIGVAIVLMYIYQTRFGSLYLHIGIVSSLFMVGLTIDAVIISYLLRRSSNLISHFRYYTSILVVVILFHTLILAAIALRQAEQSSQTAETQGFFLEPAHLLFAAAFFLSGLCSGCYFPIAAGQLAHSGFEPGQAGSKLETADHIGASAGGVVTSLALVPVLGTRLTLLLFVVLLLANLPPVVVKIFKGEKIPSIVGVLEFRRLGYILLGIGASIVICSNLLVQAGAYLRPSLPEHAAQALAGQLKLVEVSTEISDSGRAVNYFEVLQDDGTQAGYIFSSEDMAPEIRGFGGKINLAVYIDSSGRLVDFHIISSNETPAYLELLTKWYDSLSRYSLFEPEPFTDVHTVTGATVSSDAILSALKTSGKRFAGQILGISIGTRGQEQKGLAAYMPDTTGIYLIAAFFMTLVVIYYGGFRSRLIVLIFNLVIGGVWLNAQYSSEQIATILSLHVPKAGLSGAFLLVAGVPLMVILFGNIYCGYICPFGAMQELLGYLIPRRLKKTLATETMQKARFLKYLILLVLITVFFISRNRTTLAGDPLISIFNFHFTNYHLHAAVLFIVIAALVGSIVYTRFWCRYLCPAGAFLSLLNNLTILKQYIPKKRFGRCEFGLTSTDKMDCLYCDKCRFEVPVVPSEKYPPDIHNVPATFRNRYLLAAVVIVAGFLSVFSVNRFLQVVSVDFEQPVISTSSGGQPRDVDLQRIRTMIRQNKLSDKEAEFYKKVE